MRAPRSCPICGAPALVPAERPFCSAACRDRDLIAWAKEAYRAPVEAGAEAEIEGEIEGDGKAAPGAAPAPAGAAPALDRPATPDL